MTDYINTADATAVAADIKNGETAYARGEKVTGTASMYVSGTTLYIPDGWATVNGTALILSEGLVNIIADN